MTITPDEHQEDKDPKEHLKALNKLADHLARRDHSEKELRDKLSKNFSPESIDWAIEEAYSQNWLPDPEELAEKVCRELHRKNKGRHYINNFLAQKGLPAVAYDEEIELEKAQGLLENKFNSYPELSFDEKHKAMRYLSYRGFEHSVIMRAIND